MVELKQEEVVFVHRRHGASTFILNSHRLFDEINIMILIKVDVTPKCYYERFLLFGNGNFISII